MKEIKYIFKKTYNKFFIAENEKVLENIVNINNSSNKKKEREKNFIKENIYPNIDIYSKNDNQKYICCKTEYNTINNSLTEKRLRKFEISNNTKNNSLEKIPFRLLQSGKKGISIYTYYKNLNSFLNK